LEAFGVDDQLINAAMDPRRWVVRITPLQQIDDGLSEFTLSTGAAMSSTTAGEVISVLPCDGSTAVEAAVIGWPRMFPVERTAPRRLI